MIASINYYFVLLLLLLLILYFEMGVSRTHTSIHECVCLHGFHIRMTNNIS